MSKLAPPESVTSSSTKDFNVTEYIDKVKESEWWIRQKYKLMKALKKKWKESQEYEVFKEASDVKPLIKKPKMYKDDLGSSTISFDKIPMLKSSNTGSKEVNVDRLSTIYSGGKDGETYPKGQKRTVSTNTGPDLIYMLNSLKKRIFPTIKMPKIEPRPLEDSPLNREKTELTTVVPDPEDAAELRKRRKRNIER